MAKVEATRADGDPIPRAHLDRGEPERPKVVLQRLVRGNPTVMALFAFSPIAGDFACRLARLVRSPDRRPCVFEFAGAYPDPPLDIWRSIRRFTAPGGILGVHRPIQMSPP